MDLLLLASGRDADVFALDEHRVLRRYRYGGDADADVAVMTYVGKLGCPVPAVYEATGADMVMERLDGPTMAQAMSKGDLDVKDGAAGDTGRSARSVAPAPSEERTDPRCGNVHSDFHPEHLAAAARELLVAFLRQVDGDPLVALDHAEALRRTDPNLAADKLARLATAATLVRTSSVSGRLWLTVQDRLPAGSRCAREQPTCPTMTSSWTATS